MAQFPGITLTNAGLNMIAESQASSTALIFTSLKMGDGTLTIGEDINVLTAVKSPKLTAPIHSFTNQEDGQVKLRFTISNGTLTSGFFARELGIYAKIGESGAEQLYAYTNAGNFTDYIPDKNTPIDEQIIDVYLVVGNASSVSIITDSNIMYITTLDMSEHNASTSAHITVFSTHNSDSDAHENIQNMIKTKGNMLLRNIPLFGPVSAENAAAYLAGIGSTQVTLKAGTKLSFATGISDNGPMDHVAKVPSDIVLALAAAGINTVPLAYTANLCVGGTAISSGDLDSGHVKSYAFDGSSSVGWRSSTAATSINGTGYIGYVFAVAVRIRRIKIDHVDNEYVTSVKIQYSDDGTTWNAAGTFVTGSYANYGTIPDVGAHKYWRVLANSNSNNGSGSPAYWYVGEVAMYEALQTYYLYADRSTSTGVIIFGSTKQKPRIAAISDIYTDNLCIGGAAISSGDQSVNAPKERAFDGITDESNYGYWQGVGDGSNLNSALTQYIGYDFGAARHIRKFYLKQRNSTAAQVSSVKVQYSPDGTNWTDAATVTVSAEGTYTLPTSAPGRYWRLLGNSALGATGGTWCVIEITMHEIATELLHYEPTEGKSRWFDGNAWADVERMSLGSANVDSAGKIVSIAMNPYGLSRLRALPAENVDEAVTLGQLSNFFAGKLLALVTFNGTGTVAIKSAVNVSSVVDEGVGCYRINFAKDMPDTNYIVLGAVGGTGAYVFGTRDYSYPRTVSYVGCYVFIPNVGPYDDANINIAIFHI